jgi:hypothetical protein
VYPEATSSNLIFSPGSEAKKDLDYLRSMENVVTSGDFALVIPTMFKASDLETHVSSSCLPSLGARARGLKETTLTLNVSISGIQKTFLKEQVDYKSLSLQDFCAKHAVSIADSDPVIKQELEVNFYKTRTDVVVGLLLEKWTGNCERCELRNSNSVSVDASGGTSEVNIGAGGAVDDMNVMQFVGRGIIASTFIVVHLRKVLGKEVELASQNPIYVIKSWCPKLKQLFKAAYPRKRIATMVRQQYLKIFRSKGNEGETVMDPPEVKQDDLFAVDEVAKPSADPPGENPRVMMELCYEDEVKEVEPRRISESRSRGINCDN